MTDSNRVSRFSRPFWLVAACAVWMASIGNVALWQALAPLGGGIGYAIGLGVIIAAVLIALASLFAWRATLKPLLIVLLLATAFGAHFMLAYGIVIDTTMMVNVVQTDVRESADLVSARLLIVVGLLGVLPALVVWRWPLRFARAPRQALRNAGVVLLALAVATSAMFAIFQPLASTMRNHKQLRYLINPLNSLYALGVVAAQPFQPAARTFKTLGTDATLGPAYAGQARPPLLMLVIGETARSDHFSLNGYARETNPALAREDVVSLKRVLSCGTSTAASLPCMFSHLGRAGYERRDADHENLLDVLQHAGLAVLWLDNQAGCKGVCERVPNTHTVADAHPTLCSDGECSDMVLLDSLDQRISALAPERRARGIVLVMHQMGSHGPAYFKRSPPDLKHFRPECESASLQDCEREQVLNAYDNSILATDRFLASAIDWLKARADRYDSALLYVSDHGESLGENRVYLHGLPYALAPDAQKQVPWIQWTSPGFARRSGVDARCVRELVETPLSHDNLFDTVLGLMQVRTRVYRPELDAYAGCAVR